MYFVLITIICNVPTIFVQAYLGIGKELVGDTYLHWAINHVKLLKIDRRYLRTL